MSPARNDEVAHADEAVPSGMVLRLLLALVVISVSLCVVAYLLLRARESQLRPGRRFPERESGPPVDVADVRTAPYQLPAPKPALVERQRAALDGWSWVDEKRRIARMPVERAIDLVLGEQGEPAR